MSKNELFKSIRMEDMEIYLSFVLEKLLFLPYLSSKWNWEVEIWYAHLLEVLVSPLQPQKVVFWSDFLIFLIFWICSSYNFPTN